MAPEYVAQHAAKAAAAKAATDKPTALLILTVTAL